MLINCPHCGPRVVEEFAFVAAAEAVIWPQTLEPLTRRSNPRGVHDEIWRHASGCRAFFRVARDTDTHQISDVQRLP